MSPAKKDRRSPVDPVKENKHTAMNYAEELGSMLSANGQTLAVAESCTGGLLGHTITNVPGSSLYFLGGIVAYSDTIKMEFLEIALSTIKKHGAVSEKTALVMASSVMELFDAGIGIVITGIMGPGGGSPDKPVGTVIIAVASESDEIVKESHFKGTREEIKEASVRAALKLAVNFLKS